MFLVSDKFQYWLQDKSFRFLMVSAHFLLAIFPFLSPLMNFFGAVANQLRNVTIRFVIVRMEQLGSHCWADFN
jgi:hypothetical protein